MATMAANPATSNKLEYFEGEVRRLESQLTQQKVSYERHIGQIKVQLEQSQQQLQKQAAEPTEAAE